MGKRKHKDSESRIRKKIRKLQDRLRRNSTSSRTSSEGNNCQEHLRSSNESDVDFIDDQTDIRSVATVLPDNNDMTDVTQNNLGPSTSSDPSLTTIPSLPAEILDALGDPKAKEEVFGPNIPTEISERWGRIVLDGLTKEKQQELLEKLLIPDNFKLLKAPRLNTEIAAVISDSVKNRDKLLEKAQNYLGTGISGLAQLTSSVIEGNLDKIEIIKRLSDVTQVFLDLHHDNTKSRRKCIISSLDKKFVTMVQDVKRDEYLFGVNLGEKIKAAKSAEKSGLQIKRNDNVAPSARKYPAQSNRGNWKGPSRQQGQRVHRQGGAYRSRYPPPPLRRPPPVSTDRLSVANKQGPRPSKT